MVAAKLDQSMVILIVTKFRQNRLTLKGKSVGQRHTDRQTHRQTRLKIMALQVCNRANRGTDGRTDGRNYRIASITFAMRALRRAVRT